MLERAVLHSVDDVFRRQHGVASRDQLVATGISRSDLARWVRWGLVEWADHEVARCFGAPRSWRQRVMVACLTTAGLASHRTAAALHGLDGFPPAIVEVVTDRWRRRRRGAWRVHETKDLRDVDLDVVDGIPCTSLVRTLVDLPGVCGIDHAGQALDHACRRDDQVLLAVRQRFVEVARRGRNGTVKMRALLNERLADPVREDSRFETKALRLLANAGLPTPVKQHPVDLGDGTRAHLDLAWPARKVCMECDSVAHHFGKRAFTKDRHRRRQLKLLGWDAFEYTYEDVTRRGDMVVRELRAALCSGVS